MTIKWEDYNAEIDAMRDNLEGITLLDFVSDMEEAMTRHGIVDIETRYKVIRGLNLIFTDAGDEQTRDIIEIIESVMQGVIGWDYQKETFFAICAKAKQEAEDYTND